MKAIKIIGIILLSLLVIYLVLCVVFPKSFDIKRKITINAPMDVVFNQANDFNEMQNWSPWKDYDPLMKVAVTGTKGDSGYKYEWWGDKKNVGHGSMTRVKTETNKAIENSLWFEGMGTKSSSYWIFENTPEGIVVTWGDKGEMPFFAKIMTPMMEHWLAPDFEKGLQRIKTYCESHKNESKVSAEVMVEEKNLPAAYCLCTHDTANSMAEIAGKLQHAYMTIGTAMKKQKLSIAGAPFAIYYSHENNIFRMAPGIQVDKQGRADAKVFACDRAAQKAVVAHYFGRYEETGKGHEAAQAYIKSKNLTTTGAPWECYVSDPGLEKDTAKWQTDIFYPVQ